jgi:D-amino-acid dehydrogenase
MHILVLGAGLAGITSAWYLRAKGYRVTVIERQSGPAQETSYANGGQISASHVEPWANPAVIKKLVKWIGREDAPLKFTPRADMAQWRWGAQFLANCTHFAVRDNARQLAALTAYSHASLKALVDELALSYHRQTHGILNFFVDEADFRAAAESTPALVRAGIKRRLVSVDEMLAIEPALVNIRHHLKGGVYASDDESGDAHQFCVALATAAAHAGVDFRYGMNITGAQMANRKLTGVRVETGGGLETIAADALVVALGSYTPLFTRPLGVDMPIYPVKGYSVTLPTTGYAGAPSVSLTDEARKLVFSRFGERLRVAGTAELAGYDPAINDKRCSAILARVKALFPESADFSKPIFWAGLRPATPNGLPVIGRTKIDNLYVNSGQGTLGWTLACGSGRALAEIVAGTPPALAFEFGGQS